MQSLLELLANENTPARELVYAFLDVNDKSVISVVEKANLMLVYRDNEEFRKEFKKKMLALVDADDVEAIEKNLPLFEKMYYSMAVAIIFTQAIRVNSTSVHDFVIQTMEGEHYKYTLVSDIDDGVCDGEFLKELCRSIIILGGCFDVRGLALDKVMERLDDPELVKELIDRKIIRYDTFDIKYLLNTMRWSNTNFEIWLAGHDNKIWDLCLMVYCFRLYHSDREKYSKKVHILFEKYGKIDKQLRNLYLAMKRWDQSQPKIELRLGNSHIYMNGVRIEDSKIYIKDNEIHTEYTMPGTYALMHGVYTVSDHVTLVESDLNDDGPVSNLEIPT